MLAEVDAERNRVDILEDLLAAEVLDQAVVNAACRVGAVLPALRDEDLVVGASGGARGFRFGLRCGRGRLLRRSLRGSRGLPLRKFGGCPFPYVLVERLRVSDGLASMTWRTEQCRL